MADKCPYGCKNGKYFNRVLRAYQPCPHCAGVLSELSSAQPSEEVEELRDMLQIPDIYRGKRFSLNDFFEPAAYTVFAQSTFPSVINQLALIESTIRNGQRPLESCYFYTGIYTRTLDYVYSCLQYAIKTGLSAVPYVSLLDLQGIRLNTYHTSKIYKDVSYYDYTTADICFVTATAQADASEAVTLADLLAERERHGLATQVFGYWATPYLNKSKSGFRFLIHDSKRLSALHAYEVKTKTRAENDAAQGVVSQNNGSLANPVALGTVVQVQSGAPTNLGGVTLARVQDNGGQ